MVFEQRAVDRCLAPSSALAASASFTPPHPSLFVSIENAQWDEIAFRVSIDSFYFCIRQSAVDHGRN